jgi:hypothetical protein
MTPVEGSLQARLTSFGLQAEAACLEELLVQRPRKNR